MSGASGVRVRDAERREGVRHSTVFRAGVLHGGEAQELCPITNIPARGPMAVVQRIRHRRRSGLASAAGCS